MDAFIIANDLYLDFEMCVTILVKGALCSIKTFYSEEKDRFSDFLF